MLEAGQVILIGILLVLYFPTMKFYCIKFLFENNDCIPFMLAIFILDFIY